jgi:hypothetical protein
MHQSSRKRISRPDRIEDSYGVSCRFYIVVSKQESAALITASHAGRLPAETQNTLPAEVFDSVVVDVSKKILKKPDLQVVKLGNRSEGE